MNYVCRAQKPKINVPLTRYDFGWMLLCIGMAIGAGTVVVPIQIGLKGLWVFITAFLISYPATYFLQDLYMKTLSVSNDCEDYTNIITQYLGKNWGMILGVIYFLMITHGVFIYSISAIYDSASYLKTYGITSTLLSHSFIYRLIIFAILVLIASYGEKLLFKISGPMVVVKIAIILLLGFIMIPRWNFSNIMALTNFGSFFRDVLLTIPFCFFSTVFVQILNPMNIAYRKLEADPLIATYRAIRAHRLAYITLMIIILFFSLSFTFTLSHEQAVSAFKQNISALALAAEVIPGIWIQIMSTMLNVFAVVTAFLGIYLGFSEAIKGILINLLHRFLPKERINHTYLNIGIYIFIVLLLTVWVSLGASIVNFFQIGSPLYGIVSCLIPCYLVFKVKKLHKFKGIKIWCIFIFGILLVISPFLIFFENTI